jgi:hypothetical protein
MCVAIRNTRHCHQQHIAIAYEEESLWDVSGRGNGAAGCCRRTKARSRSREQQQQIMQQQQQQQQKQPADTAAEALQQQ